MFTSLLQVVFGSSIYHSIRRFVLEVFLKQASNYFIQELCAKPSFQEGSEILRIVK